MNQKTTYLALALAFSNLAGATTLKQRDASVYNYDVLFTNPTCAKYKYPKPMKTQSGDYKEYTKENVFCTYSDSDNTTDRNDPFETRTGLTQSPQNRLLNLINDKETHEIFMTYLSFSDSAVAGALCEKMTEGNLALELILDKKNEQGSIDRTITKYESAKADDIIDVKEKRNEILISFKKNVAPAKSALRKIEKKLTNVPSRERTSAQKKELRAARKEYNKVKTAEFDKLVTAARAKVVKLAKKSKRTNKEERVYQSAKSFYKGLLTKSQYLGSVLCSPTPSRETQEYIVKRMRKQKGINWSHTKVFMVNPKDEKKITLAFSSANMSSGTTIHHENWHFVTASTQSHFMQVHLCLKEAEFNYADSRKEFVAFMKKCRSQIELAEEDDIKTFIVPGEGQKAIDLFTGAIKWSKNIDVAAHRFSLPELRSALRSAVKKNNNVRMVVDDDIYLVGERRLGEGLRVPNTPNEYRNLKSVFGRIDSTLEENSGEVRYMTTNHYAHTIHHNKYLIMDNAKRSSRKPKVYNKPAVFCGAGNFTSSAFKMQNNGRSTSATNLENYYYITIPEVVKAFKKQYDYKWENLATPYKDMILEDLQPEKF